MGPSPRSKASGKEVGGSLFTERHSDNAMQESGTKLPFTCAIKDTSDVPRNCVIIPETNFLFTPAWPVRPSATRHLLSLLGPSRFLCLGGISAFPSSGSPSADGA